MTRIYSSGVQFPDGTVQTRALPINTVYVWSGSIASIPANYQLCDGTNGTPDLRNRMIVGAGNLYSLDDTGGSETVSLTGSQIPSHTHPVSFTINSDGSHSHPTSIGSGGSHSHTSSALQSGGPISVSPGPGGITAGPGVTLGAAGSHSHVLSTTPNGSHSHVTSLVINPSGNGDPHNNMPPYYALALVMWRGDGPPEMGLMSSGSWDDDSVWDDDSPFTT